MLNETVDFWIVFPSFESERLDMSQLNVLFLSISEIRFCPKGPEIETATLICRCLQALAEALKINKSITHIYLKGNQIGAEGTKAWCVVGSTESLNAAACHDVMFWTSFDSEKFGCVGVAVGCIIHLGLRVVQHMYCSCCAKLLWIVVQVSNQRDSPVSATCHLSWQFLKHITCCIALSACDWVVNHSRPWRRRWRSERGRAFPWHVITEAGKALGWCDGSPF